MTAAAYAHFEAVADGLTSGRLEVKPSDRTIATPIAQRDRLTLAIGANTLTPPTGTTMVIVLAVGTPSGTLTLKGVTGDTGVKFTSWAILSVASLTSFVIAATAADVVEVTYL
jgi:hypothetical protein